MNYIYQITKLTDDKKLLSDSDKISGLMILNEYSGLYHDWHVLDDKTWKPVFVRRIKFLFKIPGKLSDKKVLNTLKLKLKSSMETLG